MTDIAKLLMDIGRLDAYVDRMNKEIEQLQIDKTDLNAQIDRLCEGLEGCVNNFQRYKRNHDPRFLQSLERHIKLAKERGKV